MFKQDSPFIILNNSVKSPSLPYTPLLSIDSNHFVSTPYEQLDSLTDELIYIADGGIDFVSKEIISNNNVYWVGDHDSTKNLTLLNMIPDKNMYHLDTKKDYSDFGKILDILVSDNQSYFIQIYNGLYGERSHETSNIHEACFFIDSIYKKFNLTSTIYFHPSIIITNQMVQIDIPQHSSFSIIPTSSYPTDVKIQGALYEGDFRLNRPSMGTRNIAYQNLCISPKNNDTIMIILE